MQQNFPQMTHHSFFSTYWTRKTQKDYCLLVLRVRGRWTPGRGSWSDRTMLEALLQVEHPGHFEFGRMEVFLSIINTFWKVLILRIWENMNGKKSQRIVTATHTSGSRLNYALVLATWWTTICHEGAPYFCVIAPLQSQRHSRIKFLDIGEKVLRKSWMRSKKV